MTRDKKDKVTPADSDTASDVITERPLEDDSRAEPVREPDGIPVDSASTDFAVTPDEPLKADEPDAPLPDFAPGPNTPDKPETEGGKPELFATDGNPTDDPLVAEPDSHKRPVHMALDGKTPISKGQFARRFDYREGVGAVMFEVTPVHVAAIERGDGVNFEGFPVQSEVVDEKTVYFVDVNGTRLEHGGWLVQNDELEVRAMSAEQFGEKYKERR